MAGWLRRLLDERVQTERLLLVRQLSARSWPTSFATR